MNNDVLNVDKINNLKTEILSLEEQINKNEGKTPFGKGIFNFLCCCIFFSGMFLVGNFAMASFFTIRALLGYGGLNMSYDTVSIVLTINFFAFFVWFYILNLSEIYDNRERLYQKEIKKGFCHKITNVGKNLLFKRIYKRNFPLLEKKKNLKEDFNNYFNENNINIVFDFYQNNPYEFGSYEHEELSSSFKKIKDLYKEEDYMTIFSIYSEDYKNYKYEQLSIYY